MKEQGGYRKGMVQHDSWHAFDPENITEKKNTSFLKNLLLATARLTVMG